MSSIDGNKLFKNPKAITEFVKEQILSSIEHDFTNNYVPLLQLEKQESHRWISRLTFSLIKNLDAYNVLERVSKEPRVAETILEAKLEHIAPGVMSAKLSIKGIDELASGNWRASFFGGDYKNENGETIYTFDAHSTYNEEGLKNAGDELRSFFIQQFEEQFGRDK